MDQEAYGRTGNIGLPMFLLFLCSIETLFCGCYFCGSFYRKIKIQSKKVLSGKKADRILW